MATATPPTIPRHWRQEPANGKSHHVGPPPRLRRMLLLVAAILFLSGLATGMTRWIVAAPAPRFVPLWVSEYRSPLVSDNAVAEQDRRAILGHGYFSHTSMSAVGSLERHRLLEELAALDRLQADESAVIFLSAYATGNEQGELCLLPADYVPGDARSRLPFAEVLQHVERCPSRHKLLVLDLMWPLADAGAGTPLNDAAALAAKQLEKLADPHLLVLCAASAWQTSQTSAELGRSVFGYYFEQGLRGYSDGWGPAGQRDGRIAVRELAEYLRQRVDLWTWHNRHQRQTPWLAGRGDDFELIALPHGQPLAPLTPLARRAYPAWLHDAWKVRDAWRAEHGRSLAPRLLSKLEHTLLAIEEAWQLGEDDARLQAELQVRTAALAGAWADARRSVAGPPPRSLALLRRQGSASDPTVTAKLDDLLTKLTAQTAGLPAAPALAVRQKLTSQFQEEMKALTAEVLALAIFDQLAAETNPQPPLVRLLDGLLAARQPQPQYAETALLRRLAHLAEQVSPDAWPAGRVRQAIQVVRQGEEAASFCRGMKAAQPILEQAAVERHVAETILFNPGYAPLEEADRRWRAAANGYEQAQARLLALDDAGSTLDEALELVQAVSPLADADEALQSAWLPASHAITDLADVLGKPVGRNALESIRERTGAVRRHIDALSAPIATATVGACIERLRRADAGPLAMNQAALLLETPCLTADDRALLWLARQDAALRLARRIHNRELLSGNNRRSSADLETYDPHVRESHEQARAAARSSRTQALLQIGAVADGALDATLCAVLDKQFTQTQDLFQRDRLSRIYPPQAPCRLLDQVATNPTLVLRRREALESWEWLAGWYRYLSHDGYQEPFFAEAASDYLNLCGAVAETWVQFDSPRPGDQQNSRGPLLLDVAWRVAGPHATGIALPATLLSPTGSLWQVQLERNTLSCGDPLRLQVQSIPPSATSSTPLRGCLVQVTLENRIYHLPISLDDLSGIRQWDLALSANAQSPAPALDALRLRPLAAWQPYYLYLHNRSPASRTVTVQLSPAGATSQKIIVASGQWQRITFAGAAPKEHTDLPLLAGPLVARVLDAENGRQLAEETFHVGIASPREYVSVEQIEFTPTGLKPNRLSIALRALPQFSPPPCLVELALPPERIEGFGGVKAGVFRGLLSKPKESLSLTAEGLRLAEQTGDEGSVYLNVDDCPRAFVFRATLPRFGEPTTPYEDPHPALRLTAPQLALSGPDLMANLEVDQGPADASLLIELGSNQQGFFTAEQAHKLPTPRQDRIGFSPCSTDGALLFSAAIRDWAVSFDATGIVGHRVIRARLTAADGQTICTAEQPVILDDSPPVYVQLVDAPPRAAKGLPLVLVASGQDDLSGLSQATFFAGQPLDGKLPAGGPTAPGKATDASDSQWTATLELPAEAKGTITVGVQLTNGVGLSSLATTTLEIIDPATLALAKIQGSVLEGPRPQAGLGVALKDEKGSEVAQTKTGDDGTFLFDKVAPGKYKVSSSKPTSLRKAESSVTVEAAQTAVATLRLEF